MLEISELRRLREQRFFAGWDEFVSADRVAAAEDSLRRLIDDLVSLGPGLSEDAARKAVDECVCRFNDLDNLAEQSWIFTIEREDIYEQIGRVIDLCGFEYDEDWTHEREW